MNFFEYNGKKSSQFGLHIQSKRIFDSPTTDLTFQTIPGRDGDLILPDNRLGNAKQPTSMRKRSKHDFLLLLMQFLTARTASLMIAA